MSFTRSTPLLLPALLCGCATAKLVSEPAFTPEDPNQPRSVVIEPLFEMAAPITMTFREDNPYATPPYGTGPNLYGILGIARPGTSGFVPANIERTVDEKPFFAQVPTLVELHRRLLAEVQRRRPSWRVTSTGGAQNLNGPVTVVRTIIEGNELVASDRAWKNIAFALGLVVPPFQFFNINPVEETVRVQGLVERFGLDATAVPARLVKYPTQPDSAVNLANVPSLRREFGFEFTYEEGLLADQRPRTNVLLDGFIDRLASAAIALVEEP